MPEPVFSTDFLPLALKPGQSVLFRIPEYLELELGTVTGPPLKVVVYQLKGQRTEWRVPVRGEDRVRIIPFREIAAAEVTNG